MIEEDRLKTLRLAADPNLAPGRERLREYLQEALEGYDDVRERYRRVANNQVGTADVLQHVNNAALALRAAVARVISVCSDTDGNLLDPEVEVPVGEVLRMLFEAGPLPGVQNPVEQKAEVKMTLSTHVMVHPEVEDLRYRCTGCDWERSPALDPSDADAQFVLAHEPEQT